MLAIQAGRDSFVPVEESIRGIDNALREARKHYLHEAGDAAILVRCGFLAPNLTLRRNGRLLLVILNCCGVELVQLNDARPTAH